MKKTQLIVEIVLIILLSSVYSLVFAESLTLKDIIADDSKYRNQELVVSGKITGIIYRESIKIDFRDSTGAPIENSEREKNIYVVSDETESIFILSTKHCRENQTVSFKTNILLNSKESVTNEHIKLYDKYFLKSSSGNMGDIIGNIILSPPQPGASSSPESRIQNSLNRFLDKLPKDKFWVLLIEITE